MNSYQPGHAPSAGYQPIAVREFHADPEYVTFEGIIHFQCNSRPVPKSVFEAPCSYTNSCFLPMGRGGWSSGRLPQPLRWHVFGESTGAPTTTKLCWTVPSTRTRQHFGRHRTPSHLSPGYDHIRCGQTHLFSPRDSSEVSASLWDDFSHPKMLQDSPSMVTDLLSYLQTQGQCSVRTRLAASAWHHPASLGFVSHISGSRASRSLIGGRANWLARNGHAIPFNFWTGLFTLLKVKWKSLITSCLRCRPYGFCQRLTFQLLLPTFLWSALTLW